MVGVQTKPHCLGRFHIHCLKTQGYEGWLYALRGRRDSFSLNLVCIITLFSNTVCKAGLCPLHKGVSTSPSGRRRWRAAGSMAEAVSL